MLRQLYWGQHGSHPFPFAELRDSRFCWISTMPVILPNVPNTVRIIHQGLLQGIPFVNTMHLQAAGVFSDNGLQALATACHNAYFNAFIPQLNTATSLQSTTVVNLTSRTSGFGTDDTIHTGTVSVTAAPANSVAYCISWTILDRYRGGHPRMYLPGASTNDFTNGRTLTTTKQTALSSAASGYLTSLAGITVEAQTWVPVCVRYFSQHQLLVSPLIRPITDAVVHSRIDSMRRRTGRETG